MGVALTYLYGIGPVTSLRVLSAAKVDPEKRSDDPHYLDNIARLRQIFHQAGMNVRLGTLDEDLTEPTEIALPDGGSLTVEPLVRTRHRLGLKHFDPCTILLNNDLAHGMPGVLERTCASPCGKTIMSPSRSRIGGCPTACPQHVPRAMTWYSITRCAPGMTMPAMSREGGVSATQGELSSKSK